MERYAGRAAPGALEERFKTVHRGGGLAGWCAVVRMFDLRLNGAGFDSLVP